MLGVGAFAGVFALDDALMAHEALGHALAWVPVLVYGPLILLLGRALARWQGAARARGRSRSSCGLFGLSLAIDVTFRPGPAATLSGGCRSPCAPWPETWPSSTGSSASLRSSSRSGLGVLLRPRIAPHAAGR